MCAKLLILESPGKVKKVQEILGPGWKVAASVGHVRDLPVKEMGVAAPDFKPQYIPTDRGKDVLSRLAGMVKNAEEVFLATDPDREGEAIAWHLQDALKLKNAKRVTYAEITESAIRAALSTPRSIDMALVAAQEGRRVLDRFCGYMVSGPLSNAVGQKLSAGRVQSPAVRLVVERERAIQSFVAVSHFGAEVSFADGWHATWISKPWLENGQEYLLRVMARNTIGESQAALTRIYPVWRSFTLAGGVSGSFTSGEQSCTFTLVAAQAPAASGLTDGAVNAFWFSGACTLICTSVHSIPRREKASAKVGAIWRSFAATAPLAACTTTMPDL